MKLTLIAGRNPASTRFREASRFEIGTADELCNGLVQVDGLFVLITSATQYATAFVAGDGLWPAGTFKRRRVDEKGPEWKVYDLQSGLVAQTNNPLRGLRLLAIRRRLLAARAPQKPAR